MKKSLFILASLIILVVIICLAIPNFMPYQKLERISLDYIRKNAENPPEYVIHKLKKYDIVLLGEMHESKDNLDFISGSISRFYYEGGLRIFATEFVRSHNNKAINEIVSAKTFDYDRVVSIYRDFNWLWGYQGYIDIIESIWKPNNSLPADAEKIKIIGLDFEWKDWSGAKTESDMDRDLYMAEMFMKNFRKEMGKAIIHTGFNHSFLNYTGYGNRTGNYLRKEYGDSVFQICLHHQYQADQNKISRNAFYLPGFMDKIYYLNRNKSVGFDIKNSPFENLRDDASDFFSRDQNAVFGTVTEGYIIFRPLKKMKRTKFVADFVDNGNFEKAKEIIKTRGWFKIRDDITTAELNIKLTEWMNSF